MNESTVVHDAAAVIRCRLPSRNPSVTFAQLNKIVVGCLLCALTSTQATGAVIFSEDFSSVTSPDTPHLSGNEKWGPNTEYLLFPSDPDWIFSGTAVLVINPADADQAMALNEAPTHGAAITIPIAGFTPSQGYLLTFDHWGDDRPDTTPYEVDIKLDSLLIGHLSRMYSSPGPGASVSIPFTATAASHSLSFTDVTFVGEASAILDNIQINDVPEPGTWVLLAAGLVALGWFARRRSVA